MAIRCPRCGASAVTQSLVDVLSKVCPNLPHLDAYELSAAGPLAAYLRRCRTLTVSEYLDGIAPGDTQRGVVCQDVQALTFADSSFDLCTSTEVFEHVEDDCAGFREILRVLRPGGIFIFTVPITLDHATIERTAMIDGKRAHILPAEYHADRYRGSTVFCYRNYGSDITERLKQSGFVAANIVMPERDFFGFARAVIVAVKAQSK